MRSRLRLAAALALALLGAPAAAQERLDLPPRAGAPQDAAPPSRCLAVAEAAPRAIPVAYLPLSGAAGEVSIRFVGHATFLITSPDGVTIATDYNGYTLPDLIPRVVTMNRAHRTHYTESPDPAIEHVLRGWGEGGEPARHNLVVDDVTIRNVTTDIRGFAFDEGTSSVRMKDGNSIFIFEVANLCIGHLGHLHHVLADEDLSWIGQLDVVMVAVDGGYTMDQAAVVDTLRVLKARLVLPMHYFNPGTLSRFLSRLEEDEFLIEMRAEPEMTVSAATLPERPTVVVLPGY